MKDRDYLRAELTDIHNQIRASQSKMDYLLKKEEEVMSRIVSLDKKIAEIASQLKGG